MKKDLHFESICALVGEDPPSSTRPLTAPIYQASVFDVESLELVDDLYEGRASGYIYSRDTNPNVSILERAVADLEGAEDGVACSSGMAAIGVTLLSLLASGDRIAASSELYGGTSQLLRNHLPQLGIATDFVDVTDLPSAKEVLRRSPKLLLLESISNPLLRLADIQAISDMAHRQGTKVVVDNTLATPFLLRPLALGADVVVHSATKYLGGHSDVTGGVVVANREIISSIRRSCQIWGTTLDPFAAWLIVRGVKTLSLRMERASSNAGEVARYLSKHGKVGAAHYPGLPHHPQNQLAQRLMRGGFGAMVSFELSGGLEAASTFVRSLQFIRFAPSLGEAQTTLSHPAKTSHRSLSEEQRAGAGIGDGLIRLSCGIENSQDIIGDIEQALNKL